MSEHTCTACGHEHTEAEGKCTCGCDKVEMGGKVCEACSHEHKAEDGTCECGCDKKEEAAA